MKKKVLIYYPPNKRSIGLNAVVDLLLSLDVDLYVLTQEPYGQLHEDLQSKLPSDHILSAAIEAKSGLAFYWNHARYLVKLCKEQKIDTVLSHLQVGNLAALLASALLTKTKVIFFRHHFHYYKKFKVDYLKVGRKEALGERIINRFAKKIIVPSTTVKQGMIEYEGVDPSKVGLIPYLYHFDEYPQIDEEHVNRIRQAHSAHLLLLMCSRFVEPKRHQLVIDVLEKLIMVQKKDIKMMMLDDGPLRNSILQRIKEKGLEDHIVYIGFTKQVLDYMAAADVLVHPSLAEASNSSVKEMALAGRASIVCKGIGDFDDYIENGKTGFLMDPLKTEEQLEQVIQYAYENKEYVHKMGSSLRNVVMEKFSSNTEIQQAYQALIV